MKQIFTFGSDHLGGRGFYSYVVVYGRDYNHCRELMMERFGRAWAFQYASEEAAGVEKWGLQLYDTIGTDFDEEAARAEAAELSSLAQQAAEGEAHARWEGERWR